MSKNKDNELPSQGYVFYSLTKRHLLVFFKDLPTVFFTLMVPLAVFVVYILFLRQIETNTIEQALKELLSQQQNATLVPGTAEYAGVLKKIYGIADCWMVSGILAVSCITVSMNTNYIVVRDREFGMERDFISSPINSNVIVASYFTFNVIVTFLVNFIVYLICLMVLGIYGAYMISFLDFLAILGILLLSTVSASLITFFICSFIRTESVMSPMVAIISAASGFLIGAYLPTGSMSPKYIEYVTTFFPGTYSVGLLRNSFLHTPLLQLTSCLKEYGLEGLVDSLLQEFSLNIDFFGLEVKQGGMLLVLGLSIVVFGILNLFFTNKRFVSIADHIKSKKEKSKKEEIKHEVNEK